MTTEINLEIDGIRVIGAIINRSTSDIRVEILEPFSGFSMGRHRFYLGRAARPNGFMDSYGDIVAE